MRESRSAIVPEKGPAVPIFILVIAAAQWMDSSIS